MKANELRLGNIVKDAKQDYQGVVTGILSDYLVQVTYPSGVTASEYPEELAPIPLTEQWLLRAGFERNEPENIQSGVSLIIDQSLNIQFLELGDGELEYAQLCIDDEYTCGTDIYYVHQLQNLYFALTGNELTFADPHNPCTTDDPDDRCENCNCWKSTRNNCS